MTTPDVRLAVTGSTGVLGGLVAAQLAGHSVPQRLLVRNPAKAPRFENASLALFSYDDRGASIQALNNIDTLFMVSAAERPDRLDQHKTFIASAVEAGVRHIVYTSFLSAAPDATFTLARDHFATERFIEDQGVDHTFLRDSFYSDFMETLIGPDGIIRGPAGDGRVGVVARIDVARSAAAVLSNPAAHKNATYELTGPQALTMTEVAGIISDVRGTPVRYHNETVTEAYESRKQWNAPDWQNDAWVSTYAAIAAGELATVTNDVQRLIGEPPMSLKDFLVEVRK